MKKTSYKLISILILSSLILPFFVTVKAQQQTIPRFVVGSNTGAEGNWDPTAFLISSGVWFHNALETFFAPPDNWDGVYDNILAGLAENWTLHNRTDAMNAKGFMNRAGISRITMNLRPNVKFHDGSDWNATVAKWNIDRLMVVTGNLTGETPNEANVMNARTVWWLKASEDAPYATLDGSWNVSGFINTPPTYAEYGFSQDNPFVTGFWGYYPRIKNVTITNDLKSGGTIDVYYNDWGAGAPYYFWTQYFGLMSMEAYKDYFGRPMFGYGGNADFPQDHTFQHLIGTGAYKFIEFDPITLEGGSMERYNDYWNSTELQAEGWHMVEDITVNTYPQSDAGFSARNNAMVTGTLDFCLDNVYEPLVYDDMVAAPDINYIERRVAAFGENIMLNCIDETYLHAWANGIPFPANSTELGWWYPLVDAEVGWTSGGVNRAFRKAVSYAYDYDTYINVAKQGRIVRSGGFVGVTSPLYTPSIDIAYRNLTIARQALLDDPFWGARCAARNLDISNTTQEWINVALGPDPIYRVEHAYDNVFTEATNVLTTSLMDIGMARDMVNPSLNLIPDWYTTMTTYFSFPWFTYDSCVVRWTLTQNGANGYLEAYYRSPGVVEHSAYGYPIADYTDYGTFTEPFWPSEAFYNMGFSYNATFDLWMDEISYTNLTGTGILYDQMADWAQNYQYPFIYLGQTKEGDAIGTDWNFTRNFDGTSFALVKYIGGTVAPPPFPGLLVGVISATSLIALLGVIYVIRRRRKRKS